MAKLSKRRQVSVATILMLVFLIVYASSLVLMYLWGFITSLKTIDGFAQDMIGLPKGAPWNWAWTNYKEALSLFETSFIHEGQIYYVGFMDMLGNTITFSLLGPFITITVTWIMSYACSQFRNRASNVIFNINMVLMLIPIVGTLPSALLFYKTLRLYNTWGYVVLSSIGFVGANFLIFHSYLKTIPREMREASVIDGAGNFTIMVRIFFPLSINIFMILFLTAFIVNWNDYMTMVIWLPSFPSLAYGMYKFSTNSATGASWPPIQISGCMILMIPILVLFTIFKDKIIGSVTIGTLK